MNGGVTLTLPYYLVPRARSNMIPLLTSRLSPRRPNSKVLVSNIFGGITGTADFYSWGLYSKKPQGVTVYDTRAVGVQAYPGYLPNDSLLVFGINTFEKFSSPDLAEFDVNIDIDGDNVPDYVIVGIDNGFLTTGLLDGNFTTGVIDLKKNTLLVNFADAPTDGSSVLLVALASQIGLNSSSPRFTYTVSTFNISDDTGADMPGKGSFNAFSPSITNSDAFTSVDRNKLALVPISIDPAEWAKTPSLGLMVISEDNRSGDQQGFLLPVDK